MTGQLTTRVFSVGQSTFTVGCPSERLRSAVESLFIDLAEGASDEPGERLELVEHAGTGLAVIRSGEQIGNPTSQHAALAKLVTTVNRIALDNDPSRLHLHAAALDLDGVGVLIPAPSGTGKTTLAAALTERGWSYVSDEMVGLKTSSSLVTGFPKPLLVKPGAEDVLAHLESRSIRVEDGPQHWRLLPASSIPARVKADLNVKVIVVLHRPPGSSFGSPPIASRLHPADTIVALMEQTMDAERFGPDALLALANVASQSACVSLTIGELNQCVAAVHECTTLPIDDISVVPLNQDATVDVSYQVPDSVRSVLIGDRAVVHNTAGGAIAALDMGGTAIWSAIHGHPVPWWDDNSWRSSTTANFLEELADHGLLAQSRKSR